MSSKRKITPLNLKMIQNIIIKRITWLILLKNNLKTEFKQFRQLKAYSAVLYKFYFISVLYHSHHTLHLCIAKVEQI